MQPAGMPLRTWISINKEKNLLEETIYEEVEKNIVNIYIITFLFVILGFVLLGIMCLISHKCVNHFRQVK